MSIFSLRRPNIPDLRAAKAHPLLKSTPSDASASSSATSTMTDSPAVRLPLDPTEQPILDKLLEIRTRLELLKQDRSTYVRSEDVINLYYQIIEQVHDLNEIRVTKRTEQNRGDSRPNQSVCVTWAHRRVCIVDTVLDDCFQLISLSFLTIGRNNEAPAV